jgi:iron complex outermembrane receptor protein
MRAQSRAPRAPSPTTPIWVFDELAGLSSEVTSVARRSQTLLDVPAAAYVITRDQIRRSGHATLPELLRTIPDVHVARITGNKWAVCARGFNLEFSNKLLVLIDGRPLYTPVFGGVICNAHTVALDEIERIEVIRGPGGSVWGANAVNVITRAAAADRAPPGRSRRSART